MSKNRRGITLAGISRELFWREKCRAHLWIDANRVGFASAFGPLLLTNLRGKIGSFTSALHVIAGVIAVSALPSLFARPPKLGQT